MYKLELHSNCSIVYNFASSIWGNSVFKTPSLRLGRTAAREVTTLHQRQCRGCKALFSSQKNAKLHVSFQIRAEARAPHRAAPGPAAASASAAPAARATGRGRGSATGTAGYRRPGRHGGRPGDSETARASSPGPPAVPRPTRSHWPQEIRESAGSNWELLY